MAKISQHQEINQLTYDKGLNNLKSRWHKFRDTT